MWRWFGACAPPRVFPAFKDPLHWPTGYTLYTLEDLVSNLIYLQHPNEHLCCYICITTVFKPIHNVSDPSLVPGPHVRGLQRTMVVGETRCCLPAGVGGGDEGEDCTVLSSQGPIPPILAALLQSRRLNLCMMAQRLEIRQQKHAGWQKCQGWPLSGSTHSDLIKMGS